MYTTGYAKAYWQSAGVWMHAELDMCHIMEMKSWLLYGIPSQQPPVHVSVQRLQNQNGKQRQLPTLLI
jgi:hypothetical protein